MTLNPPSARHISSVVADAMPIVAWQYTNAIRFSPLADWQMLIGSVVEIRRHGQLIATGVVDNAIPSGDIAWIAADGINSRTMIDKAEGYELAIAPTHFQPSPAVDEK